MPDIVVAGHICLDVTPEMSRWVDLKPGSLFEVGRAEFAPGGCVANVGRILHRLGVDAWLIGRIGDDPFGDILQASLREVSPELVRRLIIAKGGSTSYSIVISPPGLDRTFLHMPGENSTFRALDVTESTLEGARLLHFGYPPLLASFLEDDGEDIEMLLRRAQNAGLATSLDMSLPDPNSPSAHAPWRRILERVLPFVDFFLPSDQELAFMLGSSQEDTNTMMCECLDMGAAVVVIKRGAQGVRAKSSTEDRIRRVQCLNEVMPWISIDIEVSAHPVEPIRTTGAGDAFIAGFLADVLAGRSCREALESGSVAAAMSIAGADTSLKVPIDSCPLPKARSATDNGDGPQQ